MINKFTIADKENILEMVKDFYQGPGVTHAIPVEHFAQAYDLMVDGTGPLRGFKIMHDGETAGYMQLAFKYTCEAGGMSVWIEELYIRSKYRGLGLGKMAIDFVKAEYKDTAKRIRLEVSPENHGAKKLYERLGFGNVEYLQMSIENWQ